MLKRTPQLSLSMLLLLVGLLSVASSNQAQAQSAPNQNISATNLSGSQVVNLTLQGSNVAEYLIAETSSFLYTSWQPFIPNAPSFTGPDQQIIEVMHLPYTLSAGDGEKTLYIKFRDQRELQSEVTTINVTLNQANSCLVEDAEPIVVVGCEGEPLPPISGAERERYRLGLSPVSGEYVPASFVFTGDLIRSENSTTVYCVSDDRTIRPFIDETTYFTQIPAFQPVKWLRDETLAEFAQGFPMLPERDVAFLKFQASDEVYYFIQDPLDPTLGILHWLATPEIAAFIAGENWHDYVIDLNPTLASRFNIGSPYLTIDDVLAANIDLTKFRARELLNQDSAAVTDPGVSSSLLNQSGAFIRAAGDYFLSTFDRLKNSMSKR